MKKIPTMMELYAIGPHSKMRTKLRLRFKVMENPQLKDMIINVDEEPIIKEKVKWPGKTKKAFTKIGMWVSKVDGL